MPKSNLYTRTGDSGTTSLIGGIRIAKDSARLEAYGTVDEFSATLGCVLACDACRGEIREQLLQIQNMLFNVGCYLATPPSEQSSAMSCGLDEAHISFVEKWIDDLDANTPPIRAFVLPGGSKAAAFSHVARTVCRRAERRIISLAAFEDVDPSVIVYFNRLSDYLFILSRHFNHLEGIEEIIWKK